MAVISKKDEIIQTAEYCDLKAALGALADQYLIEPVNPYTLNADCRINIWGKVTRITIHPEHSKWHQLQDGYEHVKSIQIANEEHIATTINKYPTLGIETNIKPNPDYVHVRPASTDTVQ